MTRQRKENNETSQFMVNEVKCFCFVSFAIVLSLGNKNKQDETASESSICLMPHH